MGKGSGSVSMTEIKYRKKKWKTNHMVPLQKKKRMPIELNYLEKKRRLRGPLLDRDQMKYKPYSWNTEFKDQETADKFDCIYDKAQQISVNEDMQEQYLR